MSDDVVCVIDCRRGIENAVEVAGSLIQNFSMTGSLTIIFATNDRTSVLRSRVSTLVGSDCSNYIAPGVAAPVLIKEPGSRSILHSALAASASVLYRNSTFVICDAAARAVPMWDSVVRHSCIDQDTIVGSESSKDQKPAFVVPYGFNANSLTTGVETIFNNDMHFVPAAILPSLCIASRAESMWKLCGDSLTIIGNRELKLSQMALAMTLAAHRCGLKCFLTTEPIACRAFHSNVSAQWVHESFREVSGGNDYLERYIGIDVEKQTVFGQGRLGLTLRPGTHECLVKTGMLLSELRASSSK